MKEKNHMVISIDHEQVPDKFNTKFMTLHISLSPHLDINDDVM